MHPNLLLKLYHRQLTRFMKNSSDAHMNDLKLVPYVANKYAADPTYIISQLDKIQEGNLRFLHYKDEYKPELNNEFSTYIVWPIRSGILDVIKTSTTIKIPPRVREKLLKSYGKQFGGEKRIIISSNLSENKKLNYKNQVNSQDEFLESNYKSPEEDTMTNTINNLINNKLLKRLPKLQKQAIKLRFNIAKYTAKRNRNTELLPYEKIGAIMRTTHQTARELCFKALKNMKRYSIELQIEKDAYL